MEGIGLCLATAGALAVMYLTYLYFKGVIDMKKIIVMVLGIVAALSLCACGETIDPIIGDWTCEVAGQEVGVTFMESGTAYLYYDDTNVSGNWEKSGNNYYLVDGNEIMEVNVNGNEMTFDGFEGMVFDKEG